MDILAVYKLRAMTSDIFTRTLDVSKYFFMATVHTVKYSLCVSSGDHLY